MKYVYGTLGTIACLIVMVIFISLGDRWAPGYRVHVLNSSSKSVWLTTQWRSTDFNGDREFEFMLSPGQTRDAEVFEGFAEDDPLVFEIGISEVKGSRQGSVEFTQSELKTAHKTPVSLTVEADLSLTARLP